MKRLQYLFILMPALFGAGNFAFGQFEGKVVYGIEYSTANLTKNSFMEMLPKESILYIKGSVMRMNQEIANGGKQSFMIDASTKSSVLIMNFLGQEFLVLLGESELEKLELTKALKIVKTDKHSTIAGHQCNLAYAISGKDSLEIHYAPDLLTSVILPQFAGIEGLPLKYEVNRDGLRMIYTAKTINIGRLDADTFDVEENIKEIPFSDFARSFAVAK